MSTEPKEVIEELVCFDPGGTTGYAVYNIPLKKWTELGSVRSNQVYPVIWNLIANEGSKVVIYENYLIRPKESKGFDHRWDAAVPIQIIGAIKFASYLVGVKPLRQEPIVKKPISRMTGIPLMENKKEVHHYDAMLHGAYYGIKELGISFLDFRDVEGATVSLASFEKE